MMIPSTFVFSQSSLEDYRACARRFQLRYLERLAWPAPQSSDALERERRIALGQSFHTLVRRHQSGLPVDALTPLVAGDADLARWWAAYQASPYAAPADAGHWAELVLSAPLAGYRLEAQYDLLAGTPGSSWLIVDWKTEQERPLRATLERRLQTSVYRCLLVLAGASLNGGQPIAPERITMVYWFAAFPLQPESYPYSSLQFESDRQALTDMIAGIAARPEDEWPQAADERVCRHCPYRSLCARQVTLPTAAELEAESALESDPPPDLDLEQVEEIAF